MDKQTLIFTALPNGRDSASGRARLSIFISHRLWSSQADAPASTLQAFPDMLDWPATLAGLDWEARVDDGQGGVQDLPLQRDSKAPVADSALWRHLFKPDTRVNPYRFDDYRRINLVMLDLATPHDTMRDLYGRLGGAQAHGSGSRLPRQVDLAQDPGVIATGYDFRHAPATPSLPAETADAPPYPDARPPPPPTVPLDPAPQAESPPDLNNNWGCLSWPIGLLQCLLRRIFGAGEAWQPGGVAPTLPDPPLVMPVDTVAVDAPATPPEPGAGPATPPPPAPPVLNAGQQKQRAAFAALAESLTPQPADEPLPDQTALTEEWDLHQALSAFGDYRELMRLLGMVVDVLLPDGFDPPASGSVLVQASDPGWQLQTATSSPRTHFEAEPSRLFTAAPRPQQPQIRRGFLAIDDPQAYRVVQNEVFGDALKLREASARIAASGNRRDGAGSAVTLEAAGLPALRGSGFSLLRIESQREIAARIRRSIILEKALAGNGGAPELADLPGETPAEPSEELYAEDLVRGFRVDVRNSASPHWHSLCERDGRYRFPDADPAAELPPLRDEGFVQFSGRRTKEDLLFAQTMFTWEGWSLAAPTPGLAVMEGEAQPQALGNDAATPFRIETTFEAVCGSLPKLRYGASYHLRMRVADLAGNSIVAPGEPGFDDDGPSVTAEEQARRFEPIPPPTLLHKTVPVAGESLERLVVRCYAAATHNNAVAPLASARHVLPPRGAQAMAEREGQLDDLDPNESYGLSVRESADLEYGAIRLLPDAVPPPDSDPEAVPSTVWVNQADSIAVQYLPDPRAQGLHLQFVDGEAALALALPIDIPYSGTWPDLQSIRIELHARTEASVESTVQLGAQGDVKVLRVALPPGHRARLRFNSLLADGAADSMALGGWIRQAQADGWQQALQHMADSEHHMVTPWREIELVHAAQKPQRAPEVILQGLQSGIDGIPLGKRELESRKLILPGTQDPPPWLLAAIDPHSTGSVHLRADWKDVLDDPEENGLEEFERHEATAECPVPGDTDRVPMLDHEGKRASLNLLDTRHHRLTLTAVATSRYREYFDPDDQNPADTTLASDEAPPVQLHAPNCAEPPKPKLLYALPAFHWQVQPATASDPTIVHQRGGGGLRLYLQRPWYETGVDEQIGILYLPDQPFPSGTDRDAMQLTVWGSDSTQWTASPGGFAREASFPDADHHRHGLRVPGVGIASVAGHVPKYNADRKLWYVDLRIDPGPDAWWPFVRLALARYQPYSIDGCHLSEPILADYVQLPAPRKAHVVRGADGTVDIEVSGPTVIHQARNTQGLDDPIQLEAVIERYQGADDADDPLHWQAVMAPLVLQRQYGADDSHGVWTGSMTMPGGTGRLRLGLREYLYMRGDDASDRKPRPLSQLRRRLLYADGIDLRF